MRKSVTVTIEQIVVGGQEVAQVGMQGVNNCHEAQQILIQGLIQLIAQESEIDSQLKQQSQAVNHMAKMN